MSIYLNVYYIFCFKGFNDTPCDFNKAIKKAIFLILDSSSDTL